VLEALQRTALAYLRRDGDAIPFWDMATRSLAGLRSRAEALAIHAGDAVDCASVPGGGSLPGLEIPSAGVRLAGDHAAALRAWDPPIVARVHGGATILDLRTVDPADDEVLAKALASVSSAP
jgi:L-seryl-tRNA(Ser) seleniumtransferase